MFKALHCIETIYGGIQTPDSHITFVYIQLSIATPKLLNTHCVSVIVMDLSDRDDNECCDLSLTGVVYPGCFFGLLIFARNFKKIY